MLIAVHAMTDEQAKQACAEIEAHWNESPGDLNEAFKAINVALKMMNLEIRSTNERGVLVHTMINLTDDDIATKWGTKMTASDMDVFKKVVRRIGSSNSSDDGDVEAKFVHYDKFDKSEQNVIMQMVGNKWLHLDGTSVSVAARSRLELPEFLEANGIPRSCDICSNSSERQSRRRKNGYSSRQNDSRRPLFLYRNRSRIW